MCECPPTTHRRDCFFFDPFIDDREPDLHSMSDREFHEYCKENGLAVTGGTLALPAAGSTGTYNAKDPDSYEEFWRTANIRSCHHAFDLFVLPTGEAMRASAWSDTPYDRDLPDVGVYLDSCWYPADVFGYALGWRDFGEPTMYAEDVIRTARHVYAHIQQGETVEVGCMGGHGRTGSFLAILCLVATDTNLQRRMSGKAAVQYVRDNHCKLAIENRTQERYVSRIAGMIRRGEA